MTTGVASALIDALVFASGANPSSRIGGFLSARSLSINELPEKVFTTEGISDIAPMTISAGSRGAVRDATLAGRS
jgi:hypothetical protein